ncbi:MAG: HlyD family type I secretion periplasmic adaptor subunit [Gammaproteobacteria bacterium]|nr:HlyD family type I secretion periplasmic adaptor subunit [Gammaproteobacteria bacterium]
MLSDNEDITVTGVYGKQDLAYMQSLSAAVVQRSPRNLMLVIFLMLLFVLSALIWMHWASIDVVIRGSGKVIPASQLQLIQSLEGGIVSEILVAEGEMVEANQSLIKISDIAFSGSFEENRLLYFELLARSSRLTAEASGKAFVADSEVKNNFPKLHASEENLYRSNKQQVSDTLNILEEQIRQQESALLETHSKKRQLEKSLDLMLQEIEIKKPLKQKGIISEVEFIQLLQREAEIEGELESVKLSLPRIQSTIEEARFKKQKEVLDFKNKAKKELNEVNAEISRLKEAQSALQDRVKRTILRSPVKGIVKSLHTNTIGGVVSPGSSVIEIVPHDDDLLVELKIKPADIASVSVGQLARLKFSAYDFAIHGSLQSEVIFVSADTITNEEGESYYLVRVRPVESYLGHVTKPLPIKVGMNAEADIVTDKKTILQYLIQPVSRGLNKALKEQ